MTSPAFKRARLSEKSEDGFPAHSEVESADVRANDAVARTVAVETSLEVDHGSDGVASAAAPAAAASAADTDDAASENLGQAEDSDQSRMESKRSMDDDQSLSSKRLRMSDVLQSDEGALVATPQRSQVCSTPQTLDEKQNKDAPSSGAKRSLDAEEDQLTDSVHPKRLCCDSPSVRDEVTAQAASEAEPEGHSRLTAEDEGPEQPPQATPQKVPEAASSSFFWPLRRWAQTPTKSGA